MGPRSDERGNFFGLIGIPECPLASMGPRSDERGNATGGVRSAVVREASMGPRSDERGNSLVISVPSAPADCFNGATF